jgi:hypothetical protein
VTFGQRSRDGAEHTGGGLVGGRRWRARVVDFKVGLREEMERGRERFGGKMSGEENGSVLWISTLFFNYYYFFLNKG